MFHWCHQETLLLFSAIPFVALWFHKVHLWYHQKFGTKCQHRLDHTDEKND